MLFRSILLTSYFNGVFAKIPDFNDPNLLANMPGYKGTNVPEVGYKNRDMKDLANKEISENPDGIGRFMVDTANTRPKYDFSNSDIVKENRYNEADGEFVKSSRYTSVIDKNYEDCKPEENSFEQERSCNYYQENTEKSCREKRIVTVKDAHTYTCFKEKKYVIKKCNKHLNVIVTKNSIPLQEGHFGDPITVYLVTAQFHRSTHPNSWGTIRTINMGENHVDRHTCGFKENISAIRANAGEMLRLTGRTSIGDKIHINGAGINGIYTITGKGSYSLSTAEPLTYNNYKSYIFCNHDTRYYYYGYNVVFKRQIKLPETINITESWEEQCE